MRVTLTAAVLAMVFGCSPAVAQMGGMGAPTPVIGATSPLGMAPGSPVPPIGIPFGSTELASPGLSPLPSGMPGTPAAGSACPAIGSVSSGVSGTSTIYDGGGMAMGAGALLPGSTATSGTCGTSTSTSTSTSTNPPLSVVTPLGGAARAGIPLGSLEIGNAGVSAAPVVPTPSPYPSTLGSSMPCPATGMSTSLTGC